MSDLDEQLKRGELAERQVQAMLANERSLLLEIERLDTLLSEAVASRDVKIARLRAALKPFARNANAWSISLALGHITREDLLRAAEVFGVGSVGNADQGEKTNET